MFSLAVALAGLVDGISPEDLALTAAGYHLLFSAFLRSVFLGQHCFRSVQPERVSEICLYFEDILCCSTCLKLLLLTAECTKIYFRTDLHHLNTRTLLLSSLFSHLVFHLGIVSLL